MEFSLGNSFPRRPCCALFPFSFQFFALFFPFSRLFPCLLPLIPTLISTLSLRWNLLWEFTSDFWLTIPAQLETPAMIDKLKKIFAEHEGWNLVFVNLRGKWKRLDKKISDSLELREELQTLLGKENVKLY